MLTGHSKAVIAVNSVFPFLAVLAVVLRFYARRLMSLALQADDYAILGGLVLTIANSTPYIYCATNGGMGQHIETLSPEEILVFGKVIFWTQFPYIFGVSLIKISILLFYRRIFPTRRFCLIINVLATVVLLWTIAFFFASVFQAWPISYNWNQEQPGTTIDEFAMYLALACSELVLDVTALALPWTVVWKLHLKTSRKWIISGIFTLGGFVCVSSAFRIYYFTTTHSSASQDFTYDFYNIFIWTAIEPCLGVICACLPTLSPIFRGGRSPENLLGSIKTYIQLRTQNRSKTSFWSSHAYEMSKKSRDGANSSHEVAEDATVLTSVHGRYLNDAENREMPAEGILVRTNVSMSDDGSRTFICQDTAEHAMSPTEKLGIYQRA